jgi:hypothetical protein
VRAVPLHWVIKEGRSDVSLSVSATLAISFR